MKPTAVSNTGPLIALAQADLLPVLDSLFASVLIPEAVQREIDAGSQTVLRFKEMASRCKILQVNPDPPEDPLLSGVLDRGEAAVVLLARSAHVDVTLLDERKGRKIAADIFRLKVIGTAGLLVRAKREGLIPEVRTPLDRMAGGGYYIHERIRIQVLRLAGEVE